MRERKLFVGSGIRRLRDGRQMTQAELAARLRISTAYLSQMETNQRPVSAAALYGITQLFGLDAAGLLSEDPDRLAADLREALSHPMFPQNETSAVDIRALATAAPWLAHRFIAMHGAYRRLHDQSVPGDKLDAIDLATSSSPVPFEEVRDFFHYTDNYVDALDRAAEQLAEGQFPQRGRDFGSLVGYLKDKHGIRTQDLSDDDPRIRTFDRESGVLGLSPSLNTGSRSFQLAVQIGWLEHEALIAGIVEDALFKTDAAKAIASTALVNYFAAALLMPYQAFSGAARVLRHDIMRLGHRFGASFEQVCHRLSTLQRAGEKGVPVYFFKVDRAGNIVKRHSATRFQFARFGGSCPLWNVHEAFETPDRILIQAAEMPDETTYLCLAKAIVKSPRHYGGATQRYAIGVGAALADAGHFVYADNIDLRNRGRFAKIGINCRLCPRRECAQRSEPPLSAKIEINRAERSALPYGIEIRRRSS